MTERIDITPFKDDLERAAETLLAGGLLLYPTDTVWGIGCDATRSDAVRRVFELKQRDDAKALITLLGNESFLPRYVDEVPEVAWQLIEYSTKPLTIVYDRGRNLAPELMAADGSVGIRVTREAFSAALCNRIRRPLVSTSANISGRPAPRCFSEIDPQIVAGVDYVAEYRRDDCRKAEPSSVMRLSADGLFKIIRP